MTQHRVYNANDDLLAKVCRCTPDEAGALGRDLPPELRAQLALFCYSRAHLREHGLELARACSAEDLLRECGAALGASIRGQLKQGLARPPDISQSRRPTISLARAPLDASSRMFADEFDRPLSMSVAL
jgi:hypothetical protein